MNNLLMQLFKFGLVGVVATVLDFLFLFLLTEIFGIYYLFSAAVSFVLSTLFNYVASMRFVFNSKFSKDEKTKELFLFIILSIIGLLLNQFLMWLFVEKIALYYMLAKIVATFFVMAWNFISRKIWLEGN
ncbi:GtrA family protein [uncultured Trichococcus sp.]|uniref:GtrA family protein n=1 Tax=uncultured Trichococcus sp. TaxID=189665 RepID=UPI0029C996B7|nr:GtrA family protein [uncultured Trichococcus sp.]